MYSCSADMLKLKEVLKRLETVGFLAHERKFLCAANPVQYLGYDISQPTKNSRWSVSIPDLITWKRYKDAAAYSEAPAQT